MLSQCNIRMLAFSFTLYCPLMFLKFTGRFVAMSIGVHVEEKDGSIIVVKAFPMQIGALVHDYRRMLF